MDIRKLLEDSHPIIAAAELNDRLQEKAQNILIIVAQCQRKNVKNTVKCQAMFSAHLQANLYITHSHTHLHIPPCALSKNVKRLIHLLCTLVFWRPETDG